MHPLVAIVAEHLASKSQACRLNGDEATPSGAVPGGSGRARGGTTTTDDRGTLATSDSTFLTYTILWSVAVRLMNE